jgi:hypothetical protein
VHKDEKSKHHADANGPSEGQMSLSKNSHNNQDYFAQKDVILFRVKLI